jgi:hypothetical protein
VHLTYHRHALTHLSLEDHGVLDPKNGQTVTHQVEFSRCDHGL